MLWDEDSFHNETAHDLHVVLLGSSQFLMHTSTTSSLTGRFELIKVPHWSHTEMHTAFGWTVEQYVLFGGYPGAATIIGEEERWRTYMLDTVMEPALSKDVLQITRIDKPALPRRLFTLGSRYSGQILSYQKMVGQLQDAGNTNTVSHYTDKFATSLIRFELRCQATLQPHQVVVASVSLRFRLLLSHHNKIDLVT